MADRVNPVKETFSPLSKASYEFTKARDELEKDLPGFVEVIDKHEALVRLRLDLIEDKISRRVGWSSLFNGTKSWVVDNPIAAMMALAMLAALLSFGFGETKESCLSAAAKMPTNAGVSVARELCHKKYPEPGK